MNFDDPTPILTQFVTAALPSIGDKRFIVQHPSHMLPALARWTPKDILAASEIRQVRADELDCFVPPRAPDMLPRPTCQFCHLYIWQGGAWADITPDIPLPERRQP